MFGLKRSEDVKREPEREQRVQEAADRVAILDTRVSILEQLAGSQNGDEPTADRPA